MPSQLYNNVTDSLAASVDASDTTITVSDGSKFPDPSGGGDYIPLYIIRSIDQAHEIVHITAVSGNDLTVTRSEEGTDPLIFNSGDMVQIRPTRQSLLDMNRNVKTSTGEQTVSDALDRRVIYVDTIADLQALDTSSLVDGQQVQVKEYHDGTGVGGGEFYWDATSQEADNEGTVFAVSGIATGRFKRIPTDYVDATILGGDSYSGDPFEGLQILIDHVKPFGEVTTNGWTGQKDFDSKLTITSPCKIKSGENVSFRLVNQSNLFHSTANRQVQDIVTIASSDVLFHGFTIDSNKLNNYVTFDGINFYFLSTPDLVGATDAEFRYLRGISVDNGSNPMQNVRVSHNKLINCSVHGIGVHGPASMSYFETNGAPELKDIELFSRDISVEFNYISGGCRSGIFFINGVVNSTIKNNVAEDWAWSAHRFYYGVTNCEMSHNKTTFNKGADPSQFESSEGYVFSIDKATPPVFSQLAGIGCRVGHETRAPGTCANSLVSYNTHVLYGATRSHRRQHKAIKIETGSKDTMIIGNRCYGEGAQQTSPLDIANSTINIVNPMGLVVSGNYIESNEFTGIVVFGKDNDSDITVSGNVVKYTGPFDPTFNGLGIYINSSSTSSGTSSIFDNEIVGAYASILTIGADYSIISDNKIILDDFSNTNSPQRIIQTGTTTHCSILNNKILIKSLTSDNNLIYGTSNSAVSMIGNIVAAANSTEAVAFSAHPDSNSVILNNTVVNNVL